MSDEFNDEHSGRGGSYVADADGKRVLQERTDHVAPQQTQPAGQAAAAKPKTFKVKGASNA